MFSHQQQKLSSSGSLLASITPETSDSKEHLHHHHPHPHHHQDDDIKELEKHGKRFWKRLWKAHLPLYQFHEIPKYLQDNDYIIGSYRSAYTFEETWISMFRIHNETGDVWSHFLSLLLFLSLTYQSATETLHPDQSVADKLVLSFFCLSACVTFLFSSLFHLHICHSKEMFILFGCLDYTGISTLIAGSTMSLAWLFFYCEPVIKWRYCSMIVLANLVGVIGPMVPGWTGPRFRTGRAIVFVSSGAISGAPVFHFLLKGGLSSIGLRWGILGVALMVLLYMTGVFFYVGRIPERFAPGKFDILGHSHQIWHIFVTLAALAHYYAIKDLMLWRLTSAQCAV